MKNYTLSERTNSLANVVRMFEDFKEAYIDALDSLYGVDQGTAIYNQDSDAFEATEEMLAKRIYFSISDNLSAIDAKAI